MFTKLKMDQCTVNYYKLNILTPRFLFKLVLIASA